MKKFLLTAAMAAMLVLVLGICSCSSDTPNPNLAFVGTYTLSGNCSGSGAITNAPETLSAATGSSTSLVFNFSGIVTLNATTSGTTFNIPSQNLTDNTGTVWTYSGAGTVNGNNLVLTYQAVSSSSTNSCALTGSK